MLEYPEHGITRPKMLRITSADAMPTDREFMVAVDIIIRAALYSKYLGRTRSTDELECYASTDPENAVRITEVLLSMSRTACPDRETWDRLLAELAGSHDLMVTVT